MHQQSKKQPFVHKGGHNRRPQLVLNDGRRRSSIKTQKRGKNKGYPGSCDLLELLNTEQSMINNTIVMSSVNANLLEINQAKSRINQAKKDGKEVNKMKFYECYLTLRKQF